MNINKCQGCGVEKDMNQLETYPYADDTLTQECPIEPLVEFQCQGERWGEPFRKILVCHSCFHKLEPDVWISKRCWESISPVVPFEDLEVI